MSFGSDAEAAAPEGVFLKSSTHPRAYGNFARFLGRYVRDEKVTSLQDAIRRLTSLSAGNLKLRDRGSLKPGMAADVVIFDPVTIADHSTTPSRCNLRPECATFSSMEYRSFATVSRQVRRRAGL